jgi:hypothetical protein
VITGSGEAEDAARRGWDPEGVFKSASALPSGTDLFALREQRRKAAQEQPAAAAAGQQQAQAGQQRAGKEGAAAAAVQQPPAAVQEPLQQQPTLPARRWARPLQPITPEELEAGGVPIAAPEHATRAAELAARLAADYIPVQLDSPAVRVLSWEPPVLAVEGFLSQEECVGLIEGALASGEHGV